MALQVIDQHPIMVFPLNMMLPQEDQYLILAIKMDNFKA